MQLLSFSLLLLLVSSISFVHTTGLPGGFKSIPVDSEECQTHAAFAVKSKYPLFDNIQFVVLGAASQVVAGMNYDLEVKVKIPSENRCSVDRYRVWDRFGTMQLISFDSAPC
jgi:hypothetical protein